MRIVHEGTSISESVHSPDGYGATITGTAIIPMEEGQRVSHSLMFKISIRPSHVLEF